MKKILFLLSISVLAVCCKKSNNTQCGEPELDCTYIRCLLYNYYFDFRLVDKTTGADLVFRESPRYTVNDIVLYADAGKTQTVPLTIDNGQQIFSTNQATEVMYLEIAGNKTYKINVDFRSLDCCAVRVKNLTVNGQPICTCCTDQIEVPVE